jgi:hypothetical protein
MTVYLFFWKNNAEECKFIMGPITYSLCQTKGLGLIMWICGLCAFPPLIDDVPIFLDDEQTILSLPFEVSIDKKYLFKLELRFKTNEERIENGLLGTYYSHDYCRNDVDYDAIPESERKTLGQPILFNIKILDRATQAVVQDKNFTSLCKASHSVLSNYRQIGWVDLTEGQYIAKIRILEKQKNVDNIQSFISLVSGGAK